jgi:hypothetical protein
VKRELKTYVPISLLIILLGLPARFFQEYLPQWYVLYFGDFLWAMLIYFLYAIIFRLEIKRAFLMAIFTSYAIEISQMFSPDWLEYLRSFKIFALILGYGFLWSDIAAYSLGIAFGALIDSQVGGFNPFQRIS